MTWPEARALFPVLDRYAYLNAGTFGPLSRATLDAMSTLRTWEGVHGRAGRPYFDQMLEGRERVRALFADQLQAPVDNVALTESTTQGVHVAVIGLGLGAGDEIVTTDAEHFGLTGPLAASGGGPGGGPGGGGRHAARGQGAGRPGVGRLRPDRARGHVAHAADRDLGCLVDRRHRVPMACAS